MKAFPDPDDRLLSLAEREMVAKTKLPELARQSSEDLQALAKRLRRARDRALRIARQQNREIRGRVQPRGAAPARDNAGSERKAHVLILALKRVARALKKLTAPTQAELTRRAAAMKRAAATTQHPGPGRTANRGMQSKPSARPTVRVDPREIGRVSQAVKVAQRKRDG